MGTNLPPGFKLPPGFVSQPAAASASPHGTLIDGMNPPSTPITMSMAGDDGFKGSPFADCFRIAVVGGYNVGKSCLINSLLNQPVLKTALRPTGVRDVHLR